MINIEKIIYPLSIDRYLKSHWDGEAIYLPGDPLRFKDLFSIKEFIQCLRSAKDYQNALSAIARRDGQGDTRRRIFPSEIKKVLRGGATVCASQIDKISSKMKLLALQTRSSIGYCGPVHVNAYLSTAGEGFRPHFDAKSIISIQLVGVKQWHYHKFPVIRWPGGNANLVDGELQYNDPLVQEWENIYDNLDQPWQCSILRPGDVLCLPPGAVHTAQSTGVSFSINLHFSPFDVGQTVGELLGSINAHRPEWRHIPPLLKGRGDVAGLNVGAFSHLRRVALEAAEIFEYWSENPAELAELLVTGKWDSNIDATGNFSHMPKGKIFLNPAVSFISCTNTDNLVIAIDGKRITCPALHSKIIGACLSENLLDSEEIRKFIRSDVEITTILDELLFEKILLRSHNHAVSS